MLKVEELQRKKIIPYAVETQALINLVDNDPNLKTMLTDAIEKAKQINPNRDTNPAQTLDEYYNFINWAILALPWNINYNDNQLTLYESIDQSLGYFYFIADIKLPQLEDENYYRSSLQYYPPFSDWMKRFTKNYGNYLSKPESWNNQYLQIVKEDPSFGLQNDWYEDPSNWHSFNDFFSRRLKHSNSRLIASPDDNSILVSPADSLPQGVWKIDYNSQILNNDTQIDGRNGAKMIVKSKNYSSIEEILHGSKYSNDFAGGVLTHTLLDVQDYHRFHFPISGKVLEINKIEGLCAVGGVVYWDSDIKKYLYTFNNPNWQSIETRAYVILDTDNFGKVALVPTGMLHVSSVNFEDSVKIGSTFKKGDPLGYFLFGGSNYMMIFQKDVNLKITIPNSNDKIGHQHTLMGCEYGILSKK
jgi:phosphatidylserine decarboxylase